MTWADELEYLQTPLVQVSQVLALELAVDVSQPVMATHLVM
jgi:hypothetical protein